MNEFEISTTAVRQNSELLAHAANDLQRYADQIDHIASNLDHGLQSVVPAMRTAVSNIQKEANWMKTYLDTSKEICRLYEITEKQIMNGNKVPATIADAVGGSGQTNEEQGFLDALLDNSKNEFWSNFRDFALESAGGIAVATSGWINTATKIAESSGPNAFVILNPDVAQKTALLTKWGSRLSTGCKYGLPVLGGILDYASLRGSGKDIQESAVKAGAHLAVGIGAGAAGAKIGAAAGALLGSVVPGAGTAVVGAVGAAVGFVSGFAITMVGNTLFDTAYDNWDSIKNTMADAGKTAIDGIGNAVNTMVDTGKSIVEGIGNAASSFGNSIGSAIHSAFSFA